MVGPIKPPSHVSITCQPFDCRTQHTGKQFPHWCLDMRRLNVPDYLVFSLEHELVG